MDSPEQSHPASHQHTTGQVLAAPALLQVVTLSRAVLVPLFVGKLHPGGDGLLLRPQHSSSHSQSIAEQCNIGCKGQRAGSVAGSCCPAAQEQHKHTKAALSPSLHQVHLLNKFLDLISSRSVRTKPSSCSPGWSSHASPACKLNLLQGNETSPSRQPKQQLQLQRCKSMKRGPSRGCPPAMEWVCRVPSPGPSCLPPGPHSHSQHGHCPSETSTAGRG